MEAETTNLVKEKDEVANNVDNVPAPAKKDPTKSVDMYADVPNTAWDPAADLNAIWADIEALDLIRPIAELEAFGYTVIPPEKVNLPSGIPELLQAFLDVHERRTGHKVEIKAGNTGEDKPITIEWDLLVEDRLFEQLPLTPVIHTMARYACGKNVVLSEISGLLKNQDKRRTHSLHTDQVGTPPPLPPYAQVLNITIPLTDYTLENGATSVVPCSHRFGRMPLSYEADFLAEKPTVPAKPIVAPAGSLIIWHGTTWHGSYPRKAEGVRANLFLVFCRSYMRPIRDYRRWTPQEIIDRNPPEFAKLIGMKTLYPTDPDRQTNIQDLLNAVNAGEGQWA